MKYVFMLSLFVGLGLIEEKFKNTKFPAPLKFFAALAAAFAYQCTLIMVLILVIEEATFSNLQQSSTTLILLGIGLSVGVGLFSAWPHLENDDGSINYPEGKISAKDRVKAWKERE